MKDSATVARSALDALINSIEGDLRQRRRKKINEAINAFINELGKTPDAEVEAYHNESLTVLEEKKRTDIILADVKAGIDVPLHEVITSFCFTRSQERGVDKPKIHVAATHILPRGLEDNYQLTQKLINEISAQYGYYALWCRYTHYRAHENFILMEFDVEELLPTGSVRTIVWADRSALYHSP